WLEFFSKIRPMPPSHKPTAPGQALGPVFTFSWVFLVVEVVGFLALLEGAELQNKRQQAGLTLRPRLSHALPHRCMPGAWTDAHPGVSLRSHLSRRSPTI